MITICTKALLILLALWLFGLPVLAQDSINYEGKKYPLLKDTNKNFIVVASDTIRLVMEEMPKFPGGTQAFYRYIAKELKYPKTARKDKAEGRVNVGFIINEAGRADSIHIVESVRYDIDQEAIRVIQNMPAWQPGTQDKKPVRVHMSVPIQFNVR